MEFIISGLALVASCIALFFQFFHKPRRLRVIAMPINSDYKTARFGICNDGKVNVFISGLSVDYSWKNDDHMTGSVPVGTVTCSQKMLKPGDIAEHSITLNPPRDEIVEFIPEIEDENGSKVKKFNISAYIQFAFPDGKIYSNSFILGESSFSTDGSSKGFALNGINLDLMKNSLPIKSK